MRKIFPLVIVFVASLPTTAFSNDFEAALSSETAQFTFRSDSSLIGWGGADLGFGLFYNEESDYLLQLSLLQARQASQQTPLTLGVGIKAYAGELDNINDDVFGFAIGGEIRYTIPGVMPLSIYLQGHYAPAITSFGEAEEIVDYNIGIQIEALPQTTAFIGARHIEIETDDNGDYELDDDHLHIGIRLTF